MWSRGDAMVVPGPRGFGGGALSTKSLWPWAMVRGRGRCLAPLEGGRGVAEGMG